MKHYLPKGAKILLTEDQIKLKVKSLAEQITNDYKNDIDYTNPLICIALLRGGAIFLADLVRQLYIPIEIDFVKVTSYGDKMNSSGKINIEKELSINIADRHVLIVEDIIDTGLTMVKILEYLYSKEPLSLRVCSLIDKTSRREVEVQADYIGFQVTDGFLIGYGLDWAKLYRNLPFIAVIDTEYGD
jgi:hypoxanthine phosphoribosyltransferase